MPQQPLPRQAPSPPDSNSRSQQSLSGNEAQGKILLEQLMSGFVSYPATSSPPYVPRGPGQLESDIYHNRDSPYGTQDAGRDVPLPPQPLSSQQQQQPPSPTRKSMFEFVSPFDALTPASSQAKKKAEVAHLSTGSRDTDDSWTSVSVNADPKRKSMENLMDQLTRSQGHPGPLQHPHDSYSPDLSHSSQTEPAHVLSRVPPPPLPPKPSQGPTSPRASPPQTYAQHRPQPQARMDEPPTQPPAVQRFGQLPASREKAGSPQPRGWKTAQEGKMRGGAKGKNFISPAPQQNIVFDVSQGLEGIQASRDCVKSTAIALVKVDPTFLPGTTIGATHWVAYAMTKGRVRVISRSSGDRTLLQLPAPFPPSASVTDMAVYGNRLAGVTSDGGFVVWELPDLITDDVPGRILLCVVPSNDSDPLHSVKWHPKEPDMLAVASDSNIYLLNVQDAANIYGGQTVIQQDLHRFGQIFPVPSPLVAFDFDVAHFAIATISEDSTLTLWNIRDKLPFWSQKIAGPGIPSSITFLDGGIVLGRKNGTVLQLLPIMGDNVLSLVEFVNNGKEDPEMFGHVTYDSRIQTLWIANSKRESLIAFKVGFEVSTPSPGGEDYIRGGYFEQVVEFVGPKPTIHFVILTADADPDGAEANAACVAAKVPPGELALVAFSVHSTGVDQVLIRKEWFDSACISTSAKFPPYSPPQNLHSDVRQQQRQPISQAPVGGNNIQPQLSQPIPSAPLRLRTPPSEEVELEASKEDTGPREGKKGAKGKNVGWKDKEDSSGSKDKDKNNKGGDASILNDSPLGVALSKEIRKVEENLHTRIGRLIAKELDKQHQRLEDARANEQQADFVRQEKILKLISTELTKNTTRVVETAVKGEVQNSVLPSLENITKTEVKLAMSNQISKGFGDAMTKNLPPEIEKLLSKPEISNQIARNMTNTLTPIVERYVKDAISKTLIPAYQAQSQAMHQELSREIRSEVLGLKKEIINWQTDALRGQESLIREMDQSVRALSDQLKFLTMNMPSVVPAPQTGMATRGSPGPSGSQYGQGTQVHMNQPLHRPAAMSQHPNYSPSSYQHPPPPPAQLHGHYYSPGMGSQAQMPPPPPAVPQQKPTQPSEEWDDTYLAVLGTQDLKQLRELLSRSNAEVIMPSSGAGPLSQAVILTLVHRLAGAIGETSPVEEAFNQSLWWLQRAATALNTNDPLISPYTGRVLPNVQQMLNTTKQRLALLPGGPQLLDKTRMISDVQDILSRKPM
ncbi:hypothetical protein BD410DRAFT_713619 [Rickenella mellea]|uniref:Enhancer of mRNA-decapping protein 4 WD40 repeat region domain-containing protein n=1 Tax=Rickenella mellea TaxID=50990 RepID=A0A4Y7QK45_9AGAM|nr:hypothetical protein BD410DRAFT_713619 [Rickenella mellea]